MEHIYLVLLPGGGPCAGERGRREAARPPRREGCRDSGVDEACAGEARGPGSAGLGTGDTRRVERHLLAAAPEGPSAPIPHPGLKN